MSRVVEVLQTVLPVLVMLLIGMLCRSRKLISREGVNALKNVVVNITLPAVLVNAFATTSYSLMDVVIPLLMFLVCFAAWGLGRLGRRLPGLESRFVPFLTTVPPPSRGEISSRPPHISSSRSLMLGRAMWGSLSSAGS